MTASIKPITLYGAGGPNPSKVAMILEELSLPYTTIATPFSAVKSPEYVAINPNGRLPTIHDPNTDLTLWESGAIVEYLIDRYDHDRKFSFAPGSNEAYLTKQWLIFQVSGQGPYFGQAVWFRRFHHEQVPSALERYVNEVKRVCGVVEAWLGKQKDLYYGSGSGSGSAGEIEGDRDGDGPWLVGNRITFADLAWVQWHRVMALQLKEEFDEDDFPLVKEWITKMMGREAVKKVIENERLVR